MSKDQKSIKKLNVENVEKSDSEIQDLLPNEFYEYDTSYEEIDDYYNIDFGE